MKSKILIMLASLAIPFVGTACANAQKAKTESSKVYFTSEISPEALVKIYDALGKKATGKVAIKISTGEPGGHNFLQPSLIEKLVKKVDGTIVECNTAYGGKRSSTADHLKTAADHGFTAIAPVDIMDADGEIKIPVRDTLRIKYDIVGDHIADYDCMINLAHFKGHAMAGFGGVLKNASIGVASANGKTYIHTAGASEQVGELWNNIAEQDHFLEAMAAAAQGVDDYFKGNVIYICVANNLSVDCDCDSHPAAPQMGDLGILASLDPVALDKACVDMVYNSTDPGKVHLIERMETRHGIHTVEHAEAIGLGSQTYELVNLDK